MFERQKQEMIAKRVALCVYYLFVRHKTVGSDNPRYQKEGSKCECETTKQEDQVGGGS